MIRFPILLPLLAATPAAVFAQANDFFGAATAVTAGVPVTGSNQNASPENGEPPSHWTLTYAGGVATGRSVWYSYTPAASGLARFTVVGTGTGAAVPEFQGAAYTGQQVSALTRIASACSTAGTAGPPAAGGIAHPSNLFAVTAGVPVFIQVTGSSATAGGAFTLTVNTYERQGEIVLPRYSEWEWLHPVNGFDPTASASWTATWKTAGDTSNYNEGGAAVIFSAAQPAPLGFAALNGAPGIRSAIGTASGEANNAAYFRTTFTLSADTSNLWAEILADDGAYIYVDDHPPIPVHIAAKLADGSSRNGGVGFADYRPQEDVFLTGALPANPAGAVPGCRGYVIPEFDPERRTKMVYLSGLVGQLSAGSHQIAVSLHQTDTSSSDLAFDMQLIAMQGWPLASASGSIDFTDVPVVVPGSGFAPGLEHHYAPGGGQSGLAWYCVSPAASLTQGIVAGDDVIEDNPALRLNAASDQRFVTEPVNVEGLSRFSASVRIRAHDTSSGFEDGDGLRVFLETSTDGINFSEPAVPLELQSQISGAEALSAFNGAFFTKLLNVSPNPYKAVRMVMTGGVDSGSELLYLDDISFAQFLMSPVVTNVIYDNKGSNARADDTVSFDLSVTASGNTAPGWTTSGLGAGNEVSGTFGGAAVTITRPAADASGVRQDVVFSVVEDGHPENASPVTVTTPAALVNPVTVSNPVRSPGANRATAADDTFTYDFMVTGTATGVDFEVRSSGAGNPTLYATGTYGTVLPVTLPAGVTSVTVIDRSAPAAIRVVPLPPAGVELAMGRVNVGGVNTILYSTSTAADPATASRWRQATGTGITPEEEELEITVDETTLLLNPVDAVIGAGAGDLQSTLVDLTGRTGVRLSGKLRAFENSEGSGFETTDLFLMELIERREAGDTVVNLITGNPADAAPANEMLNGSPAQSAAEYDAEPGNDEFNGSSSPAAGNSRRTLAFEYAIPADVTGLTVRLAGRADSASEHFFVQHLVITDSTEADTDADGLPDSWEQQHFNGTGPTGADDSDGDGQNNAAELAAGTVPSDGNSAFRITSAVHNGGQVSLTFASVAGKKYQAQSSTNLTNWTVAGDQTTASEASTVFSVPGPEAGQPRFYRVVLMP